jgi:uncharacterized protein
VRIVLDTNVLGSAIFFSGPPNKILHAWSRGKTQLVVTPQILDEYRRVLIELHEKFPGVEVGPILDLIVVNSELCAPARLPRPICADPGDDKFFAGAVASNANIIVSGDKHLKAASVIGESLWYPHEDLSIDILKNEVEF